MAEELVQQKSILLDSLAILERCAIVSEPEAKQKVQPEVWEKQLDDLYEAYFDIVARLEVMTSIDHKLERMEFDGKYYKLSAHILSAPMLPPLPSLPCNDPPKPVATEQAAPPRGGSSTASSRRSPSTLPLLPPLPPRHSSSPKLLKSVVPEQTGQASSGSSAAGISSLLPHSSCSEPPPEAVVLTATAAAACSSSAADSSIEKPRTERGIKQHLYQCPEVHTQDHSQETELVRSNHFCMNCLRARTYSPHGCSGTYCRTCKETHDSLLQANHSQTAFSGRSAMLGQKQRQVSRQPRSTPCTLVQQELPSNSTVRVQSYSGTSSQMADPESVLPPAMLVNTRDGRKHSQVIRCLLDTAARVLPRVLPTHEKLLLQPKHVRYSAARHHHFLDRSLTANPVAKLHGKLTVEHAQLDHVREIDRPKVVLPQRSQPCHPLTKPDSYAPDYSAGFEDSCRSESDFLHEKPGLCIQSDSTTTASCTSLHPAPVCADIWRMFRQILVRPTDQLFPCIWWRDTPNLPSEAFELSTVPHGVSNAPSPNEPFQFLLVTPGPRCDSTADHRSADKDSPLTVSCEPASAGFSVRQCTAELRERSLLRDLFWEHSSAAVCLYMADYKVLKPPIRRSQIGQVPLVQDGHASDWQKLPANFSSAHQFRNLNQQIIRHRRFRHMGGIGPPWFSESHPRQTFWRRKHSLSMAAGQLNEEEFDCFLQRFNRRVQTQHVKQNLHRWKTSSPCNEAPSPAVPARQYLRWRPAAHRKHIDRGPSKLVLVRCRPVHTKNSGPMAAGTTSTTSSPA